MEESVEPAADISNRAVEREEDSEVEGLAEELEASSWREVVSGDGGGSDGPGETTASGNEGRLCKKSRSGLALAPSFP
ncbi:unnamed protein product [Linum trigynum]|uniref:Uncharacterized protein n=1 Tax=Linum trigynum TaxID=586398 RepID=A0AAV2ESR2_9ROSI